MTKKNTSLRLCLMIGLCFLFTSSGYLTWLHHLMEYYSADTSNLLSEVVGYLFQVCGLGIFCFFLKKEASTLADSKTTQKNSITTQNVHFLVACVIDLVLIITASICTIPLLVVLLGFLMNFFHGIVAGFYLSMLIKKSTPTSYAGIFGFSYAIGTVTSWMISLLQTKLSMPDMYLLLIYSGIITLIGLLAIPQPKETEDTSSPAPDMLQSSTTNNSNLTISAKMIVLAVCCILLISLVNSLGFCLPLSVFHESHFSLEFTRLFYAIGLIAAGVINNKSRKFGGVACICALFFPFIELLLKNSSNLAILFWCIGYIFFGFLAVYRVTIFFDFAKSKKTLLFLAPCGLLVGRIGDAAGAFIGTALQMYPVILCAIAALFFIASIIVFFVCYEHLYFVSAKNESLSDNTVSSESEDSDFATLHNLSVREQEVLTFILSGKTNKEIADQLFVSENTIKFHVKNILKKTSCANRRELISLIKK